MSNPFNDAFSLTVDGTVYPLDSRNLELGAKRFEFAFLGRVPVVEAAQSVIFSYRRTHSSFRLRDSSNNQVPSFAWDLVNNREIPPEQVAYAALGRYFEGTGSLSSAETFVSDYLAGLWAKIGGGSSSLSTGLSGAFNVGTPNEQRTAWGTDGTLNWHQVGGPGGGTSHTCSGQSQPRLQGRDSSWFFFACSGNPSQSGNQWVPVKMPVAGIDFTPDGQLTWTSRHQSRGGGCMKTAFDPLRISYDENGQPQQGTYLHQWFAGC